MSARADEQVARYYTVTERYEEVKRFARKSGPCALCGKRMRRQHTFTMTISPFNRNTDGSVRTRTEIDAALAEKAKEWEAEQMRCGGCAE